MRAKLTFLILASLVIFGCGGTGTIEDGIDVYATTNQGRLIRFKAHNPDQTVTNIALTGLQVGEVIEGMDFRGSTGILYGVSNQNRLYTINTSTGAVTPIGDGIFGPGMMSVPIIGMDFNDVPDRIRIVNNINQNYRIHPDTGDVIDTDGGTGGVQLDTALSPSGNVIGCAYTTPDNGLTTLYGIDGTANTLVRIGGVDGTPSPNGGIVTTIGSGLGFDASSTTIAFDITNQDFPIMSDSNGSESRLYLVNLDSGAATLIGEIGSNIVVMAMASNE